MSNKVAAKAAEVKPSALVVPFVEHTCFNTHDQLKDQLQTVAFRLFSVGTGLGVKLDVCFYSNYGVYFDHDDELLIAALTAACPAVNWRVGKVYFRWLDRTRIQVLDDSSGKVIAQIETRRYYGRKVCSAGVQTGRYGNNVVSLADMRQAQGEQP